MMNSTKDPGRRIQFYCDNQMFEGIEGEPVAMSLWRSGVTTLGWNEVTRQPRGVYCAMGHCFECRMTIDGMRDQRACLFPVHEGLEVFRQSVPLDLGES